MSQTFYLWNSYKGIVNKFDNATGSNLVTKFNDLLHRAEGEGNQNYYTGKIGNITYTNVQVFPEGHINPFKADSNPNGHFFIRFPANNDVETQNLNGNQWGHRVSMLSFHDKTNLTEEEIKNFYADFALSRGFNRSYSLLTSTELPGTTNATSTARQAKVSLNNDGNYVDVADGEFKIRFTRHDENPFEGIGILCGFATWPLRETIFFPEKPNKFGKDYALKCFFDEDVTELETSHVTAINCTIKKIWKSTNSEYWVIFEISEPAAGEWWTEYTITVNKDSVTAVNDVNKKNRTQSITSTCIKNDGNVIFSTKNNKVSYTTDLGNTWTEIDGFYLSNPNTKRDNTTFGGNYWLYAINLGYNFWGQSQQLPLISDNAMRWYNRFGATQDHNETGMEGYLGSSQGVNDMVRGKDASGNDLVVAVLKDGSHQNWGGPARKCIIYSRDGGTMWFKAGGTVTDRQSLIGYAGLGSCPDFRYGRGVAYGNGIWVACGQSESSTYPNNLLYSNDGYNWHTADSPHNGSSTPYNDVIFCKDTFIIIGSGTNGFTGYSTDGKSWTMNTTKLHYNQFQSSGGPRKLATDNSGVVLCIGQGLCWPHYSDNNRPVVYRTTDFGKTWSSPQTFTKGVGGIRGDIIWNGSRFFVMYATAYQSKNWFAYSNTDGTSWTEIELNETNGPRFLLSNYYPEESNESEIPGLTNSTVAELMGVGDISLNYFPANLVPQAWWENLVTVESEVEERKKENDTRRNYLFNKLFESNQTIDYFDISTNVLNMPPNTIKETIRVYKKDANNSFEINLSTNTDINKDRGYYVALENDNDKIEFTNATNDISFNLIRTGVDSDGYALYDIVKTGGTSNFVIDF